MSTRQDILPVPVDRSSWEYRRVVISFGGAHAQLPIYCDQERKLYSMLGMMSDFSTGDEKLGISRGARWHLSSAALNPTRCGRSPSQNEGDAVRQRRIGVVRGCGMYSMMLDALHWKRFWGCSEDVGIVDICDLSRGLTGPDNASLERRSRLRSKCERSYKNIDRMLLCGLLLRLRRSDARPMHN